MNESPCKALILVDGSSYLYRAFHALPPLSNSRGEPTGAVYGVVAMLRKLLEEYAPARIAIVFDARGPTFRDELYAHYKAHRPSMPTELAEQVEPLEAVVRAMGLPLLSVAGVEADDVIGTLARQASALGLPVLISTGDKDMAQLVSEHVEIINTMSGARLGRIEVTEKYGVPPERIADLLALAGDASDNIPGVPKVGPKTAAKWLQQYGSLESLMRRAGEMPGKLGENLRACLGQLPLARALATIKQDVELNLEVSELRRAEPDSQALAEWYKRLEFKSWLAELLLAQPLAAAATPGACRYEVVLSEEVWEQWLQRLANAELFAFDTETTSLDYMQAELVGVSFAVGTQEAAYVPLAHDYPGAPPQLSRAAVLQRLRPLLEDPQAHKLGHNLKYDMSVLARYGIRLRGVRFDSMLESYVLDSTATRHDLDTLALKYLGRRTIHFEDVAGKGASQLRFNQVALEQAAPYAAEDAEVSLRLHQHLWRKLVEQPGLRGLYEEVEVPLIPVLSKMERNGVLIDTRLLQEHSRELAGRLLELEEQAYAEAGRPFNLGSPKQIQEVLYAGLGLPVLQRTPKGQPSTAESALQDLARDYALPRLILAHRGLSKLKSTYTDRLPQQVNPHTGRVHTSYHQAVAATGRLSSSDPNLQNIPVREGEGRRIRQAFIAPPGYRLLAADYSQIELRIMAHLSADEGLLHAFATQLDVHRATAAEVFGVPLAEVDNEQRRSAKAINFGLIYGMSAFGLARQLGIPREAAQAYMERYFARYPGVQAYMERTRAAAREQGYVETLFGRRLHVPDIHSRDQQRRRAAERTAINAPMQGSAADIVKRAMIGVHGWLEEGRVDARMILQVHDELVLEVPEEALGEVAEAVRRHMAGAAALAVPLVVDIGVGSNWDEAH